MRLSRLLVLALALALALVLGCDSARAEYESGPEYETEYEYEVPRTAAPSPQPTAHPTLPTPMPTSAPTLVFDAQQCRRVCTRRYAPKCKLPTNLQNCACRRAPNGKCRVVPFRTQPPVPAAAPTKNPIDKPIPPAPRCLKYCPRLRVGVCARTGAALGCRCVVFRGVCIAKPY